MFYQTDDNVEADRADVAGPDSVKAAKLFQCGTCHREFEMANSPFRPFCSERCQQVDLGNWLNESYGLPFEDSAVPDSSTGIEDDPSD